MSGRRVFRLFACCIAVRGARRSAICDVQRQSYRLIPNGLYDLLTEHRDSTLEEMKAAAGPDDARTVEEYFAFLAEQELGFWTDSPEAFPEMDLGWEAPERITNAIVDVGARSNHDWRSLLEQLDGLGCKMLQIRWFGPAAPEEVDAVLELTRAGRLRTVELLIPWSEAWTDEALRALCRMHGRISAIHLHGAPEARKVEAPGEVRVALRTRRVDSAAHCGEVHPAYFTTNVRLFTEAQRYNSCLNRKLSVDEHGEIRNCPALPRSFGNAASTRLADALEADGFRAPWSISKDQVEVCRDCEFRYVCTDCRAFVADAANPLSKPAKCAYDPYTATWGAPAPACAAAGAGAVPQPAGAA